MVWKRLVTEITMDGVTIPRAEKFRYLGSIIDEKRDID